MTKKDFVIVAVPLVGTLALLALNHLVIKNKETNKLAVEETVQNETD